MNTTNTLKRQTTVHDEHAIEQLQAVMVIFEKVAWNLPRTQRCYAGNAMLNVALNRMRSELGAARACETLQRLAHIMALSQDETPARKPGMQGMHDR